MLFNFQPRNKGVEIFDLYFKCYGIITLKKHVDVNHGLIEQKIE
jgi:hypothetical protein